MYENIRRCTIEELEPTSLDYIKKEYSDKRKLAKSAGFAINYGGNGGTIAKNCSIPKADGEFVYQKYFEAFPNLRNYFDKVFNKSAHFSYVEFNGITKRKYFFNPDENPYFMFREAVEKYGDRTNIREYNRAKSDIQRISQNYPIQGSSADITKYACILFFKEILLRNWWMAVKIINLVHDEILIEAPKDLIKEATEVLVECMKNAGKPFCPIIPLGATADTGDHWIH